MVLKTLFLFSFALAQLSYGDISVDDRCKNEIEKIFKTSFENNKDKVYQFLSNQAHLTLHRLAWAHLKTFQADSKNVNTRLSKVENTIIQSLKHKYSKTYAEELKNFSETAQDRYREVLSNMSSDLINLIQTEKTFKETNEIYHLNYQDVFLIDLLGEIEKSDDYKYKS